MNKLFTKIVGAALGLTMAIGVGVAVASNSKEATPVHAAAGDILAEVSGTGSSYGRQTTTDSYGVGWVTIGQSGYLGINSAKNNTGAKAGVNANDLPVAKAVDASATSSTSTDSDSCTGYYTFHTTSSITNAGSMVFYYSANSGNSSAKGYVVYGNSASTSGGTAWTKVELASTSTSKQGDSLGTSGTFTYTFASTQTSAKYYGFVIETSSYKRMTGGKITIKEGSTSVPTTSVDVDPATVTLAPNATQQLTTTVLPANTTDTLSYSTTDGSVATVSSSGLITAHSDGTATITATSGNYSDTCVVTVETPSTPFITPDKTSTSGYTGCDETIGFTYGNLDNSLGVSTSNANVSAVIDNDDGSSADVVITPIPH